MGYAAASLDIVNWNPWIQNRISEGRKPLCKGNPLDLVEPSGFAFLAATIKLPWRANKDHHAFFQDAI